MNMAKPESAQSESGTLYVSSVEKGLEVPDAIRRRQSGLGPRDLNLSEISRLAGMEWIRAQPNAS